MSYFELALTFANNLMSHIPDYDQRKRERFFKLKSEYQAEKVKEYHLRDDQRLLNLKDELEIFLQSFSKEVNNENS